MTGPAGVVPRITAGVRRPPARIGSGDTRCLLPNGVRSAPVLGALMDGRILLSCVTRAFRLLVTMIGFVRMRTA